MTKIHDKKHGDIKKNTPKNAQTVRLDRAMSLQGLASRREAKEIIKKGAVLVNNTKVEDPGRMIYLNKDIITLEKSKISKKETVIVYKPTNIETTKTNANSKDLKDLFPELSHLSPVGRLDKASEGLIIMTNDGTLTKALTGIDSSVGKEYIVTVRENISDNSLLKMSRGIKLDGQITKPAKTKRVSRTSFLITLYEGRKHQIRRMADACRLTIASLKRVAIGPISIKDMKVGSTRKLSDQEVSLLKS